MHVIIAEELDGDEFQNNTSLTSLKLGVTQYGVQYHNGDIEWYD